MRLKKPTETGLVYQCLQYLALRGITAWRQNTGLACGANGRQVRFGFPGCSDIIGFTREGVFVACECKRKNRPLTPEQANFLRLVDISGGIAIVVRDDPLQIKEALERNRITRLERFAPVKTVWPKREFDL